MESYLIKNIKIDSFFTKPVFLDDRFVLLSPEMQMDLKTIQALNEWGFHSVLSEGTPSDAYFSGGATESDSSSETVVDREHIEQAEQFYKTLYKYTRRILFNATGSEFNFAKLAQWIQEPINVIRNNKRYILRIITAPRDEEDPATRHTVQTTILTVIIGLYIKLPNHKLIELAICALLHEIGMLKLSPQHYICMRQDTPPSDQRILVAHPIMGYSILLKAGFPVNICMGVLEHHERENGSGYPKRLVGDAICQYAKIISLACHYVSTAVEQPDVLNSHEVIVDILKNKENLFDISIVRALVSSLSLYPIGSYVLLSSGRKAQVINSYRDNLGAPVVQIFGERSADGRNKIINTASSEISIARPLTQDEISQLPQLTRDVDFV
ncbi:MAG: HD domain-containing protein [Treponema sp.]|jgi:HD-GYP domain-containing protein (c-di-GMP phosphodiesterase class II)|nr:HD domain-containing protein [Treponema sp.]